jgi:VPDSG-CTERM motif
MKRLFLVLIAASFWTASPAHALPLTWHFFGTTSSSSQFSGMSIGNLDYELRILLDTDLVAIFASTVPDIQFSGGPHPADIEIDTLGVLPLNPVSRVLYHAPGGAGNPVTEVQFYAPGFNFAHFAAGITSDSLHLSPIPLTVTSFGGLNVFPPVMGPNGLSVSGPVNAFAATATTTTVPEGGSTAILLSLGVSGLALLRRRYRG